MSAETIEVEDEEEDAPAVWAEVSRDEFDDWHSKPVGRSVGYVVREEDGECGRRVRVNLRDRDIIVIETWLDQWGLWVSGLAGNTGIERTKDPIGGAIWTVAQEFETRSFLYRLIEALTWLREWDYGTPKPTKRP